jgi:hypothetical protein
MALSGRSDHAPWGAGVYRGRAPRLGARSDLGALGLTPPGATGPGPRGGASARRSPPTRRRGLPQSASGRGGGAASPLSTGGRPAQSPWQPSGLSAALSQASQSRGNRDAASQPQHLSLPHCRVGRTRIQDVRTRETTMATERIIPAFACVHPGEVFAIDAQESRD